MQVVEVKIKKPRNCALHGLFGSKYLKHHNLRDDRWTLNDLIEQLKRLTSIYCKDNEVKDRERQHIETIEAESFRKLSKQFKDNIEELQIVLRGDVQRTKNVLINFPNYMRVYQNKQSYEVLEELDIQTFHMRKTLDRCMGERQRLMNAYETYLTNVAQKQEMIRYYDIKEFQQERDTKRLYVELQNSETRWRAIEKMNLTYKYIMDQLLHDSLYYQPVLEALNDDWKEQARLLQETFNIGFPTIRSVKKIEKRVQRIDKATKRDEELRFLDLQQNRFALKQDPKKIKELVRRDSDFIKSDNRYARETSSMIDLRMECKEMQQTVTALRTVTRASAPEDVATRLTKNANASTKWREEIAGIGASHKAKEMSFYEPVRKIMLDLPKVYKDELLVQMTQVQRAFDSKMEQQQKQRDQFEMLAHTSKFINHSIVHIMGVLRHVDPANIFAKREYPNGLLKANLLRFNKSLPKEPPQIEVDAPKVISIIKAKLRSLMQYCSKKKEARGLESSVSRYQQAIVEEYLQSARPRVESKDFD